MCIGMKKGVGVFFKRRGASTGGGRRWRMKRSQSKNEAE